MWKPWWATSITPAVTMASQGSRPGRRPAGAPDSRIAAACGKQAIRMAKGTAGRKRLWGLERPT